MFFQYDDTLASLYQLSLSDEFWQGIKFVYITLEASPPYPQNLGLDVVFISTSVLYIHGLSMNL